MRHINMGAKGTQNTAAHMFRLDLKECCTCVPPRPEKWLIIRLLDCCTARKPMRVKISCSVVYSKLQNSIWIKSCAVSTDRPFLTDCLIDLSRTVRYWRWRAYCKSGTNCSVRSAKKYRGVQNVRTEQNTEPVKKNAFTKSDAGTGINGQQHHHHHHHHHHHLQYTGTQNVLGSD